MVFHVQLADVICTDDPTLNCHDLVLTAFICVNEDVTVIVGKYTSNSCRDVNIVVCGSNGTVVVTVEEVDDLSWCLQGPP